MKRLSTFLCTLALLLVGASSAKAEKVYEIVYSDYTGFPFFVMGYVPEWNAGILTDNGANYRYKKKTEADEAGDDVSDAVLVSTNDGTQYYRWTTGGGWHQYFIGDGIPTAIGGSYKVKALVKASAQVTFNVNMGWGWGTGESVGTNVTVPQSNDFVEVEWEYNNVNAASCNLVAQPGGSNVIIEWKSIAVYTADPKEVTTYGDLVEFPTPAIYVKHGDGGGSAEVCEPDGSGVYVARSITTTGDDWTSQFWIGVGPDGPALPVGQKFKIKFDYKADHAATAGTQTHKGTALTENAYLTWHCIGNVDFGTEWDTFEKTQTIESDMGGWQSVAFNLNVDKTANNYYFRNIKIWAPEVLGESVDITLGASGWTSFSSAKNVSLGSVKGYAAKAHGSYIELIPVTQVPAGNAVLIEGTGKYSFDVIPSATAIPENDLQISNGSVTGDGSTIFALGKKSGVVGFVKVKNGTKIPSGKAYIVIAGGAARDFIGLDDATGIDAVKQNAKAENLYFNLAGQRVAQPTKGLYIVNGKKVIVK